MAHFSGCFLSDGEWGGVEVMEYGALAKARCVDKVLVFPVMEEDLFAEVDASFEENRLCEGEVGDVAVGISMEGCQGVAAHEGQCWRGGCCSGEDEVSGGMFV